MRKLKRIEERLLERYQIHNANVRAFIEKGDLESASMESLMKTECEIAIEIVQEEMEKCV